ncbi:MAG: hypothetical protein LOY01_13995 [Brachybacterium paraconglomeratum]|uniref:Uncharacterized protein n=1 Tax=Brachybacterium paraconglomeratum TaxID=173362 RepID=A0A921KSB0_9MICO|nr:hypothetical protein [Brachybacterium paraconglomeratum]HJF49601.1 hypothetical protein [Brachybacterium paraconglomeratum]
MNDLVVPLVVGLAGLLMIALSLWFRVGRPVLMSRWMDPWSEDWQAERSVLLGLPTAGAMLLCVAAVGAIPEWNALRLLVVGAMGLLVVPMLYCLIAPLPLPGFLYPAWARALRDTREERMEALLSELSDGD